MVSRTWIFVGLTALAAAGAGAVLFSYYGSPRSHSVRLVLNAKVGDAPLDFNKFTYINPAGDQEFRIRNFRFYVSNVKLYGKEGAYIEKDSYHLARFDNPEKSYTITLKDVPLSEVSKVALSIGVDAKANKSIKVVGDLDPNSQMAWNWQVGYKFVLLEGSIRVDGKVRPLVYHVGFSENRRDLVFERPRAVRLSVSNVFDFTVDISKMFSGKNNVDMAKLQSVKFDKDDARLLADNYARMIDANWN